MAMRDGFVLRHVRRATAILALVNGGILTALTALVLFTPDYWINVWEGPFPMDAQTLVRPDVLDGLGRWFVTVDGGRALPPYVDSSEGKSTWRFTVLEVRGRYLLVKGFTEAPSADHPTGHLDPLVRPHFDSVVDELATHIPGLRKRLLPVYLSADAFQPNGQDVTYALALVAFVCLWNLHNALARWRRPEGHPSVRRLRRHGAPLEVCASIDSEVAEARPFVVTEHWLVFVTTLGFEALALADITSAREEPIPTAFRSPLSFLIVRTADGADHRYNGTSSAVGEALDDLACRAPRLRPAPTK